MEDQASYQPYMSSPQSSSSADASSEPGRSVIRRVQDKYATVALTMAFLLYSTVSTVVFQVRLGKEAGCQLVGVCSCCW